MKKVFIKYDPYKMKTILKVDNKEIHNSKHCDVNLKKYLDPKISMPIQAWIDPIKRDGWNGLLPTLCQMGDTEFVFEFWGRKIDYQFIQESLETQNKKNNCNAKLTFCKLTKEIIPDIEMKRNIDEVINLMLTENFEQMVTDSQSQDLIDKYNVLKETYEEIDAEEFRIVFTGTYSSGKSSTINALVGKNLLPTASGTCTAKVCKIIHEPKKELFAKVKYIFAGKVKEFICKDENEVQDKIKLADENVERLEVYTDLSVLYPSNIGNDFKLVLIDTPGTDSALGNDTEKEEDAKKRLSQKSHIEITKEILKSKQKEMVVLISDNKVEDENIVELLDIIEESAEEDNGAFNDRFLFVMNMCDALVYNNAGESLENSIKNFITNIRKIPNSERRRNIVSPRVFPITSGAALAVVNGYTTKPGIDESQSKKGELYKHYKSFCECVYHYSPEDDELKNNFSENIGKIKEKHANYINYCLEKHSSISETTKYRFEEMLEGNLSLPERIKIHSGIPSLENAIKEYIRSYAFPIKVRQLLNCFSSILSELATLNETKSKLLNDAKEAHRNTTFARNRTENEKKNESRRKEQLSKIKEKMDHTKKKVDGIKESIPEINKIRASFFTIQGDIAQIVNERTEILWEEGVSIIKSISTKIESLLGEIQDEVYNVKQKKKNNTEELYNEFINYLNELERFGLMSNGSFSLKDTVTYQELVDKENLKKAVQVTRIESNPNKKYIEFDNGLGNFFSSINRAWKTRNEPQKIEKKYLNIARYISDNINPMEEKIDNYVEKIRKDYQDDIRSLKNNVKNRIDLIIELIKEKDATINRISEDYTQRVKDENASKAEIETILCARKYLDDLISKINYMQI